MFKYQHSQIWLSVLELEGIMTSQSGWMGRIAFRLMKAGTLNWVLNAEWVLRVGLMHPLSILEDSAALPQPLGL